MFNLVEVHNKRQWRVIMNIIPNNIFLIGNLAKLITIYFVVLFYILWIVFF